MKAIELDRAQKECPPEVLAGITLLVRGGRDFDDDEQLYGVLDALNRVRPIKRLVHGAARGADWLAGQWAHSRRIPWVRECPPDWDRWGRSAGVRRNQQMLDEEDVDLVLAFPGERGIRDMVRRARKAGVKVIVMKYDGDRLVRR